MSAAVSRAIRDHEMVPSSCVSLRMDVVSTDYARSRILDALTVKLSTQPDQEGRLHVASLAWLNLLGGCVISKC